MSAAAAGLAAREAAGGHVWRVDWALTYHENVNATATETQATATGVRRSIGPPLS
jgi:hypothetical protein